MRITVEGDAEPAVVAALTAAVQALLSGGGEPEGPAAMPAWRRTALLEGVAAPPLTTTMLPAWRASTTMSSR